MALYAAVVIFLLGCAGTVIIHKRGGKFKAAAAVCAAVSLFALFYIAAAMLLVGGIE